MCHRQMVLNYTAEKIQVTSKSIVISIAVLRDTVIAKSLVRF